MGGFFSMNKGSLNKILSGLAGSAYPKFQHDQYNSGQSTYQGPLTSAIRWKNTLMGISHETSPVIGADGTIYIQSVDESMNPEPFSLFALKSDGSVVWSYTTGEEPSTTPAIGLDGTIYFGSYDGNVYALMSNGLKKWSYPTGDIIRSSPAIGSDGTIYIAGDDTYLYALNPDGTLKWKYMVGLPVYLTSPAIGEDDTVYISCYDDELIAINPDGTVKWFINFNFQQITNPAIGPDGTIYVGSDGVYAINPDSTLKWKYTPPQPPENISAVASDGTIYYTTFDTTYDNFYMEALTPAATKKWEFTDGDTPLGYSAIGSDGTIYFGGMGGYLYALNPNGMLKWKYQKPGIVHGSPAIGPDGTLYVANANCAGIYALQDIKVTANPRGGRYKRPIEVRLKMNQNGTIYWRYQQLFPSRLWTRYIKPINIYSNKTIEFYGKNMYGDRSKVQSAKYYIQNIFP